MHQLARYKLTVSLTHCDGSEDDCLALALHHQTGGLRGPEASGLKLAGERAYYSRVVLAYAECCGIVKIVKIAKIAPTPRNLAFDLSKVGF